MPEPAVPLEAAHTAEQIPNTMEASRTLALGADHCDPLDIKFASQVDRFDFAMEVTTDEIGRRLEARSSARNDLGLP